MTDILLVSGTSLDLNVGLVNQAGAAIDLVLVDTIVWEVFAGNTAILKKNLSDDISVTGRGKIQIKLRAEDTAPAADTNNAYYSADYYGAGLPGPILGSKSYKKIYTHETRLKYQDNSQEVPGSFCGRLILTPTKTWDE